MSQFLKDLSNSLAPFDLIMLSCGILLFLVFIILFVDAYRRDKNKKSILGLLPFAIIMIGYPTIQKIQFDGEKITIEKIIAIANSGKAVSDQEKSTLEQSANKLGKKKNLPDDIRLNVAESFLILENPEESKRQINKIESSSQEILKKKKQLEDKATLIQSSQELIQNPNHASARKIIDNSFDQYKQLDLTLEQRKIVTNGLISGSYIEKASIMYATIPDSSKRTESFILLKEKIDNAKIAL